MTHDKTSHLTAGQFRTTNSLVKFTRQIRGSNPLDKVTGKPVKRATNGWGRWTARREHSSFRRCLSGVLLRA
jgi:hypothetical protein